jgi:Amt family ammonium transporter
VLKKIVTLAGLALLSAPVLAQQPQVQQQAQDVVGVTLADSGDTAWVLTASALVLMMTIPGLALFYGGLVRAKNVISVAMHCFAITAAISLLWVIGGYSLAFSEGTGWLGGLDNAFLANLAEIRAETTVPESAFVLFQMMFAIITPALIIGTYVDRVRFGWMLVFSVLWTLCVYIPVAHWVWGGGWLAAMGAHDFAGGIVVHTTAGVSALAIAIMLGKRNGFPKHPMPPHSPALVMTGAGLLWVGWYGFNGGSALAAGDDAATAIINTHVAACAAALVWALIERIRLGKATGVGIVTGAVAGLATITPAAGYIGPMGAIALGGLAGLICFTVTYLIKERFTIDDSLDVFAVHGVGGMLGSLTFPLFVPILGGPGFEEGATMGGQLGIQAIAVGSAALWSVALTVIIGLGITLVLPMRVSEDEEQAGLDLSTHGERGWNFE